MAILSSTETPKSHEREARRSCRCKLGVVPGQNFIRRDEQGRGMVMERDDRVADLAAARVALATEVATTVVADGN
jgi:hypothetical protein